MAVMSIHAQEICVFNSDNEMNLNDEVGTAIDAGTIIGQTESIVAKIGANDTYKPYICPFIINGVEYGGGLQGRTNPTDADGVAPNLSLKVPNKGAFLQFEAKDDGFLYVLINASSNKAYTVFRDGNAMGYTFAAIGNEWPLTAVYQFCLSGGGIFNYLSDAGIDKVEFAEQEYLKAYNKKQYDIHWSTLEDGTKIWDEIKALGLGAIKFPVNKGCKYIVNANGSKIASLGFIYTATDNNVVINSCAFTIMDGGDTSSAQEIYVFNQDNDMNLDYENGTGITKGTTIGETENIVAKVGANDFYKPNLQTFVVGDTEYLGGLQGSINPTDADGVAPNLSLKVPNKGAFLKFEAKADGFLYVIHKASSNKAYTVFENEMAIGYTFAAFGNSWPLPDVYQYTLAGGGEHNYLTETGIEKVEFAEQEYLKAHKKTHYDNHWITLEDGTKQWDVIKAFGLGVIKFRVYKDCTYIVNENGGKITQLGFIFSTEDNVTVKTIQETILNSSKAPEMIINAQEFCVLNQGNGMNLDVENGTDLSKGTVVGETYNIVARIGADNRYRPYFYSFTINGAEYWDGIQGSSDPKDADGVAPNLSLKQPERGAFLEFEAKANGFLYVIHKSNSSKAYTVFEDGKAIGYNYAAHSDKAQLPEFYQFTLKGGGEHNYLTDAGIYKVEFAEQEYLKATDKESYDAHWSTLDDGTKEWANITSHGLAIIRFQVKAGCKYIVNANGSKMHALGFAFNTEDNIDIKNGNQTVMPSGDTPQCATPTINYENGVLSFSCTTPGVTYVTKIANEESNTAYGKEIKLSKTLKINVYATKANYAQSEAATTEIEFDAGSNLKGDINKDGVVNVADHVELSKIIMKQEE